MLAADKLGTKPSNILIYKGKSNDILEHHAELHFSGEYQYCTIEPLEESEEQEEPAEEVRCVESSEYSYSPQEEEEGEEEEGASSSAEGNGNSLGGHLSGADSDHT